MRQDDTPADDASERTGPFSPGAMLIDTSLRVIGWDSRMKAATGLSFDEVADRPCWSVLRGVGTRGGASCAEQCELAATALRGDSTPTTQMIIPCRHGHCDALLSTSFVRIEGEPAILHLVFSYGPQTAGERDRVMRLTPRQQQVLQLLNGGLSTTEIARELGVAENTARNHIRAILRELRADSRMLAVAKARRLGIVGDAHESPS